MELRETKLKYFFILFIASIFTFVNFISCKFFSGNNSNDSTVYSISGYVANVNFTDESRTAFPSNNETFYYTVKAKCGANEVTAVCSSVNPGFDLKLTRLNTSQSEFVWNVTAEGFSDSSRSKKCLVSSVTETITLSNENPNGSVMLLMKPLSSDSEKGGINLDFDVAGTDITKIICNCISTTQAGNNSVFNSKFSALSVDAEKKANLLMTDIPSDSYTVDIMFYKAETGKPDVLLYYASQIINVYDNLTTKNWVKHGDEEFFQNAQNGNVIFKVESEMTQKFILTTIYIDSTTGNDSNRGTWAAPLKTFDKAIDLYNADSNISVIFISTDDINKTVTANKSVVINNSTLTIKKNPRSQTKPKIVFTGETLGQITTSCVKVAASTEVYINDIDFTAGTNLALAADGGAFEVSGELSLTNVTISGFELTASGKNGAAIYVSSTGTLNLAGENHITGNKNVSDAANQVESNIYLPDGKTISITGDLAGSEIGITLEKQADLTPSTQIVFTSGFSTKNEQSPYKCFVSDSDYVVGYQSDYVAGGTGEAVLAVTGGNLYVDNPNKDIRITISDKSIKFGKETDTTVTIKVLDSDNKFISTNDYDIEYSFRLNNESVPSNFYAVGTGDDKNTFTVKNNIYYGHYNLYVYVTFGGTVYSSDFPIIVKDSMPVSELTVAPTSGVFDMSGADEFTKLSDWSNNDGATFENVSFVLDGDLDLTTVHNTPIGKTSEAFLGTIDGNGHQLKVTNWVGNPEETSFIQNNKGVVRNLIIDISTENLGCTPNNGFITRVNCSEGIIRNIKIIGSLQQELHDNGYVYNSNAIAIDNKGIIENCVSEANITVNLDIFWTGYFGVQAPFVAYNSEDGIIRNCVNYGTINTNVSHSSYPDDLNGVASPVCGYLIGGSIENCYWLENTASYDDGTVKYMNNVAFRGQVNDENFDLIKGTTSGNGYFTTTTITAWDSNTLQYGTDLLTALNAYVDAHPDNGLVRWKIDDVTGHVTLDF